MVIDGRALQRERLLKCERPGVQSTTVYSPTDCAGGAPLKL